MQWKKIWWDLVVCYRTHWILAWDCFNNCDKLTMDEHNGSSKLTGIKQIVKFKEILQKWQSVTLGSRANSPRRGSPHSRSDRRVSGNILHTRSDRMVAVSCPQPHSDQRVARDNTHSHSDLRVLGGSPSPLSGASSPLSSRGGISPAISKRLTNVICWDSDEDTCASPEPPPDVPEGYLAVYVGPELRRFIIPTSYLSHNLFKVLLEKAEEEFGFDHCGGLTIPCETETFKYLLKCMENHEKAHPDESPGN